MFQNLCHVTKTSKLQYLNLRTSRYMINTFNRDYVTQPQQELPNRNLDMYIDTSIP
ncbi:3905_t:CDS:1, partial [Cetraspora pellucida]